MTCTICFRQAKGFGWYDAQQRAYTERVVFCSMRCQATFSTIMQKTEGRMIDPSEMEIAAMHACLGPLGDYVAAIGIDRPLASYRKEQVLHLIEIVITAYQEHMQEEHARVAERDRAFFDARLARASQAVPGSGVPF